MAEGSVLADETAAAPQTVAARLRSNLVLRPFGNSGQFVIKDPATGGYFNLGPQEAFLLGLLDGTRTAEAIGAAFEERFHESFTAEDLADFLELAQSQGFLEAPVAPTDEGATQAEAAPLETEPKAALSLKAKFQSLLYWRKSLIDPDRLLTWLEPRLRFLYTPEFFAGSVLTIAVAFVLFLINSREMVAYFPTSWETIVLAWFVIAMATTLHEFAHGLTCKHHGGEVHEIGFLLMFFMPCFYCDVSDAWLMKEKSKRLWVTLAGTWCDLCLWAGAVFLWRLTLPGTLINAMAMVIITVCGARCFMNFMPLLKLDGYYFLSDLVEIPNLRSRSFDSWMAHVRWLLWGARRPDREPRGLFLLLFGGVSWTFSLFFLCTMLVAFVQLFGSSWGVFGLAWVAFLAWWSIPGMFSGFSEGEIMKMLLRRHVRTLVWAGVLTAVVLALVFVQLEDRAAGTFKVRSVTRTELRAQVPGYLRVVYHHEGHKVSPGTLVAILEIPDLESKLSQKRAELAETKAKLDLLRAGPRLEEVRELTDKVARAQAWRELAEHDLARKQKALTRELERLDAQISQYRVEMNSARESLTQARRLFERQALAQEQLRDYEKRSDVALTQFNQAQAQKLERDAVGTQEAEAERDRRAKEHKDAESALRLLKAGTRPEEILAQQAHLDRLAEEYAYLDRMQEKLRITTNVAGVVTTPHLREKIGSHFKEGDLICEVEDPENLRVEVPLQEQELYRVQTGQTVDFKPRALPFHTFTGSIERIAPAALKVEKDKAELQATVTLYCQLDEETGGMFPGMTGYARINCGQRPLYMILATRTLRYLRTEFWW